MQQGRAAALAKPQLERLAIQRLRDAVYRDAAAQASASRFLRQVLYIKMEARLSKIALLARQGAPAMPMRTKPLHIPDPHLEDGGVHASRGLLACIVHLQLVRQGNEALTAPPGRGGLQ